MRNLADELEKEHEKTLAINTELQKTLEEVRALREDLVKETAYRKMSKLEKWKHNVNQASLDTNNDDPTSGPTMGAPET